MQHRLQTLMQMDTLDNVFEQFFNDLAFDPCFSLTTNQPYSYMNEDKKEYYCTEKNQFPAKIMKGKTAL